MDDVVVGAPGGRARGKRNPLTRSAAGVIGLVVLLAMVGASLVSLPWTLGQMRVGDSEQGSPRYSAQDPRVARLGPSWWGVDETDVDSIRRLNQTVAPDELAALAEQFDTTRADLVMSTSGPELEALRSRWRTTDEGVSGRITGFWLFGTDKLGRSLFVRVLAGGGVSLTIGIAAALVSVVIGTLYGSIAAYAGGKVDGVMMRAVDVLYGLPYILLVVLLAVAGDALIGQYVSRQAERDSWVTERARDVLAGELGEDAERSRINDELESRPELASSLRTEALERMPPRNLRPGVRTLLEVGTLLVAIGGVSWLTLARVVRGQVLSLKGQPFVEAAGAMGARPRRIFFRHLLPNLVGPVVVYATLTVPQAILQESFLSFLGIGVEPPLPSWGNLVADGLSELNTHGSRWWLLLFPSAMLGLTLLALNFVGEGLREAFDPRRAGS